MILRLILGFEGSFSDHFAYKRKTANPAFARLAVQVGLVGLEPMTSTMSRLPFFSNIYNCDASFLRSCCGQFSAQTENWPFFCFSCNEYHPSQHVEFGISFGGFMHPRPLILPILERLPFCQRNAIIRLQAEQQPENTEGGHPYMSPTLEDSIKAVMGDKALLSDAA